MPYVIRDRKYKFVSIFDPLTGGYARSGIIENGKDTGVDPFMASFPHLIDVGVMGHCNHGKSGLCVKAGVECYQDGLHIQKPNMTVADFADIARQCKGRTNQFALGGRGDPDQHEDFEMLLQICRENRIVPNFTTSGLGLTARHARLCKQYCGAVAVSWYRSDYTLTAIQTLLNEGVKTNIHYVLGQNSIDEALERLKHHGFPEGINAVIFLLHKPAGLGSRANMLCPNDPRLIEFFRILDTGGLPFKMGVDSCAVPGIVNRCRAVTEESLDTCEGGRFSCYISADMKMLPCSFDQSQRYAVSLQESTIEQAWNSAAFEMFRRSLRESCPTCPDRAMCKGGCPLMPEVVLCERPEKAQVSNR